MNSKKPVLSISLLCSGRAKTTKKCLDSLKSLREKVECELIIVDTGCDEKMRELLSSYTDIILPFTWCNDFSAARNVGIKAAKGEWFIYLDDDEWFLDTKEIEDFFLSGDYKKYYYACYIQRNYLEKNKDLYTDTWVSRMVCMKDKPRFVSTVHEYFSPLYNPCKLLHSMVEHFGYIYESKEEERAHSKRNVVLLRDMIKKKPKEIRWWTHLEQEYRATDEYEKMEELCLEGLENFKNDNTFDTCRERGAFYCGLLEAQVRSSYYERAEESFKMALADKRNTDYCRMRLYNIAEEIYYKTGNYEEVIKCAEKYVEYYELMKDDEDKQKEESAFFVLYALDMAGVSSAFCFYILAALRLGDTSVLKKYFHMFNWTGVLMLYDKFTYEMMHMLSELPYDAEVSPLIEVIAKRRGYDQFWEILKEIEEEGKESEEGKEKFYHIARIFMDVEAPYYYVWYLKILYADYAGETKHLEDYYERLWGCVADIFQLSDEIFDIAERNQIDISRQFEKIPFERWKTGVDSFFEHSNLEEKKKREAFVKRTKAQELSHRMAVRYEYFEMKAAEANVVQRFAQDDFYSLQARFQNFVEKSLGFYRRYFKKNAFTGEMEMLPPSCRVAVKWEVLMEAQLAGDRELVSKCLKESIGVFPDFDEAIQLYTRCYATSEKIKANEKANQEKQEINQEMQALAVQIKRKISELLAQGRASDAYQVLLQLQTLMPGDVQLAELEKEILEKM